MKRFIYKAKDRKTGQMLKGHIQAENERTAGKLLIDQGYVPESIKEEDKNSFLAKLSSRVTAKDKVVFTRQFATLIGAGLPLSNSLKTVAEQTENKAMKSVIENVLSSVEAGKSLGDAFGQHPEVFDKVYLSLITAGEMSGTLDESLKRLAMQQEKDAAMMSKIRGGYDVSCDSIDGDFGGGDFYDDSGGATGGELICRLEAGIACIDSSDGGGGEIFDEFLVVDDNCAGCVGVVFLAI